MERVPATREAEVILVGGRGGGKTTLLGAIEEVSQQEGVLKPFGLQFLHGTGDAIIENRSALKAVCAALTPDAGSVKISRLPTAGGVFQSYNLQVSLKSLPKLTIKFIDSAGEDLDAGRAGYSPRQQLVEKMGQCATTITVIDAAALFQQDALVSRGAINEAAKRNRPEAVADVLKSWTQAAFDSPKCALFVLTKVETYLYDANGRPRPGALQELYAKARQAYEGAYTVLANSGSTVIVTAAVQTCGCLRWDGFDTENKLAGSYPDELWRGIRDPQRPDQCMAYRPLDCELPLGYVLNFFSTQAERRRQSNYQATLARRRERIAQTPRLPDFIRMRLPLGAVSAIETTVMEVRNTVLKFGAIFHDAFLEPPFAEAIRDLSERCVRYDGSVLIEGRTDLLTLTSRK